MPENYIALFSTPTKEKALQIIEKAEPAVGQAIHYIKNGDPFPQTNISFIDRMSSGVVNDLFYPLFVHAKKFHSQMPAYPAANAQTYVLFAISGLKKEGLSGEIHAPTAWPVSAAVPKRLSSMENIVRGCPAILAPINRQ